LELLILEHDEKKVKKGTENEMNKDDGITRKPKNKNEID